MRLNRSEIRREARILIGLAWPVMLTSLNWTLMHLIDVKLVGQASTHELAALAAGRTITFISIVMGMAALVGVLVFASRADGAKQPRETGEVLRQGVLFALALGLICLSALMIWAEPMVRAVGVAPAMAHEGAAVVRGMALAYPFQFVLAATGYFLEGVSRPRRVMVVNLVMLPANALLAWAWVGGHLGLPAMGAVGAVMATSVISAFGSIAILAAAWTLPDAAERGVRDLSAAAFGRALRGLPALARFGAVPSLAAGLELAGFSYLIALSTQLGQVTAAAFQIVFSLHNFTFAFALGLGSAAGVRVGNAVGAGEPEQGRARALIAAIMAMGAMAIVGAMLWSAAAFLVAQFSDDRAVIAMAGSLLALMAPFMLFDGLQLVFLYALRSFGDQVIAGVNGIIAFFVVTGGLGWVLVDRGVGPAALVYASVAGMIVAAALQGARLWYITRQGRLSPATA